MLETFDQKSYTLEDIISNFVIGMYHNLIFVHKNPNLEVRKKFEIGVA